MSTPLRPPAMLPPHYFCAALVIMAAAGWLDGSQLIGGGWQLLGIVPVMLGVALAVAGARRFGVAQTSIVPFTQSSTLVTEGVFRVSRNPMYLGMLLALTGVAVLLNGYLPWLVVAVFTAILQFRFVQPEEQLMEATFGDDYRCYRTRFRRWL